MAYNGIPSQAQASWIYKGETATPWVGPLVPAPQPNSVQQFLEQAGQRDMLNAALRNQQPAAKDVCPMLDQVKTAKLDTADLEHLLALSAFAKLLTTEYEAVGLDAPDWLLKRQRALRHAMTAALEAQIDKLDTEEKALREKEQKRQDIAAQREKLRRVLDKAPA